MYCIRLISHQLSTQRSPEEGYSRKARRGSLSLCTPSSRCSGTSTENLCVPKNQTSFTHPAVFQNNQQAAAGAVEAAAATQQQRVC